VMVIRYLLFVIIVALLMMDVTILAYNN
jgi:hypothetical protein